MAKRDAPSAAKPAHFDRIPPYSEEAERGVLGSALLEAERVIDLAVERQITPESFYIRAHQTLWELLIDMNQRALPVDLLTVGEELRRNEENKEIVGDTFLEGLIDSTPTALHAEYYIGLVRQKFVLRTIIAKARDAVDRCYAGDEDADEILGKTEADFFEIAELKTSGQRPWPDLINHSMEEIEKIFQQKAGVTGIPSGYRNLDQTLLGFQQTDMLVLAARPSMGKTSLALNIVEHIALGTNADHTARPIAFFSLEMSSEQLVRRMICCKAKVSAHKIASGYVSQENHGLLTHAASALRKAKVVIDDSAGLSILELRSRARRLKRKYDIQMIVIDYLQLMNHPQFARDGRQREVAAISGAVKGMAKELKVPVLVLSQLSRAPENRDRTAKPKLSDLRDSGSIEQDADVVILLRRPSYYPDDPESEDTRLAIVDIAKHRNGPTGEVRLNFERDFMRFEDRREGVDGDMGYGSHQETENE